MIIYTNIKFELESVELVCCLNSSSSSFSPIYMFISNLQLQTTCCIIVEIACLKCKNSLFCYSFLLYSLPSLCISLWSNLVGTAWSVKVRDWRRWSWCIRIRNVILPINYTYQIQSYELFAPCTNCFLIWSAWRSLVLTGGVARDICINNYVKWLI